MKGAARWTREAVGQPQGDGASEPPVSGGTCSLHLPFHPSNQPALICGEDHAFFY